MITGSLPVNILLIGPLNLDRQTKQATTSMGTKLYIDKNQFDALEILAEQEGRPVARERLQEVTPKIEHLIEQVENAGQGFMWIEFDQESGYTFRTMWAHNIKSFAKLINLKPLTRNDAMQIPITKKITNESKDGEYRFTFYCDLCEKPTQSAEVKSETVSAGLALQGKEHREAFEKANLETKKRFNHCPLCMNVVCDDCFHVSATADQDMCVKCHEKPVREKKKPKNKPFLIAVAVCLALLLSTAGIQHLIAGSTAHISIEDGKTPLAEFPLYETAYVKDGGTYAEMSVRNPEGNAVNLIYEIVLEESGETLFVSGLLEPGMAEKNLALNRALEAGEYKAILITRAYEPLSHEETGESKSALILIAE